ncbi:MAG: hypothetical protein KJO05_12345 [Bacteroidia bacterium]|nr:hypothetical protein [Bacteroidia bacterium]NNK54613.1 hypothetical protein [Flavobacteriaceae bacterium]
MKNPFYILLLVFSFGISTIHAQHELAYSLKVGDSFRIAQKAIQNIKMTMDDQDHNLTNTLEGSFQFKVQDELAGSYIIETFFEEIKLKTESDILGTLNDVDTSRESDADDMEANIFKGLLDSPFYMTLRKDGKIVKLEGADQLLESMLKSGGIEDASTKELVKQRVEKQFGAESLAASMEQMTYMFPQRSVGVSDSWNNEFTGDLTALNTWTLDYHDASEFKISCTSTIKLNTGEDTVAMELEGIQNSRAVISTESGFLKTLDVEQKASGTTIMNDMGGAEVDTTIDATINYKRI